MAGWRMVTIIAGGAAILALAQPALAQGVSVSEATAEQAASAQKLFLEADELFDVQKYDEAIAKYRESYDIVASPNSRLMVARGLREVGRLDEAFHEYEATLEAVETLAEDHEGYATTAEAARDELQALRSRVAWLTVELGDVPEDAELTVAGKPVEASELDEPLVVIPGRVDVVATTSDGRIARGEVHLAAARESRVTLKLDETVTVGEPAPAVPEESAPPPTKPAAAPAAVSAAPQRHSAHTPLALVAAGVGVAGFATFGVFGSQAKAKFEDLESACPDGQCPPGAQDDIDSGRMAQTLANVGLGVGIAGVGASAALFYLGHRHRREAHQVHLRVSPAAITLEGSFR